MAAKGNVDMSENVDRDSCSSRHCGVLFPNRSPIEPTDFDGCILPAGHDGQHEFIGADLLLYGWETDMDCDVYRLIR